MRLRYYTTYISMLKDKVKLGEKTLCDLKKGAYKKYSMKSFPWETILRDFRTGNNPPLYFYPFNTLVFRLNPCRIPDQENSFQFLI